MAISTTTTSITLNWTPAGGANSLSQSVQRSPKGAGTWTNLATGLGAAVSTYTDNTAIKDTAYDYRIVNICSVGGPTNSGTSYVVDITCPTVTAIASGLIIGGSYGDTFNDVSYVDAKLFDVTGTAEIQPLNPTPAGNAPGDYAFTDAGVEYSTDYIVRFYVTDGTTIKECDTPVSVGAAPTCDAPTGLTAVVA